MRSCHEKCLSTKTFWIIGVTAIGLFVYFVKSPESDFNTWIFAHKAASEVVRDTKSHTNTFNRSKAYTKVSLMDCKERANYLNSLRKQNIDLRQQMNCPIRDIIQKLYSEGTSDEDFTSTVSSLGKCNRIYSPKVGKCASRTVIYIFRELARKNQFSCPLDGPLFDFPNPVLEHDYITNVSNTAEPVLRTRQVHYINFTRHQLTTPVQINVIRDPIARLTSAYYYSIHGSKNQETNWKATTLLDHPCLNKTLDETVAEMGDNLSTEVPGRSLHPCWPRSTSQIFYFCDCLANCKKPGKYRLNQAMRALTGDFLLVGMTENIPEYMEALELIMPHFFKGAKETFQHKGSYYGETYKTRNKVELKEITRERLRGILADDYTFYYFARQRFQNILKRLRKSNSEK